MDVRFTDRELDIMEVLWTRGASTVAEVRDALTDDLAYNTVLTMLRILEEKGHVTRDTSSRAHRYAPSVAREAAGEGALRRVARRLFQGSPEALLVRLVAQDGLSAEELRRMRDILDERLRDAEERDAEGRGAEGRGAETPGANRRGPAAPDANRRGPAQEEPS
ncbi:MAG: BlaI/MecI/CopY family transcriptional regulator [Longimicrobiales bacterium]|nr:BlaI/MecI/CopY family transcriptional regulator [Longimicrobiales bacterium]